MELRSNSVSIHFQGLGVLMLALLEVDCNPTRPWGFLIITFNPGAPYSPPPVHNPNLATHHRCAAPHQR